MVEIQIKSRTIFVALVLLSLPTFVPSPVSRAAGPQSASIYDESKDGSKQIAEALSTARKERKRVLMVFGANWCIWCRRLHKLFDDNTEIASLLKYDYVVVMVDVNQGHNKEVDLKYGSPTRLGLPVLVVLDSGGKCLTTKDSGELEEGDHHSPEKVIAFLKAWACSVR